ncbi:AAA family ATPase [Nostoc sp. CENA67]|uniref:AAA family ATPase n=1 Tax=Amazonocrinis nigriterrae CENA67 TaxID=2794033 RepID=A0A8J7HQH4_9NOST|nr:AAA family ATPase [Amazonocrinis nigriterrae]MBH8561650.1 AAA family ATPase [Amazonocrinis nigriterrae CENA67]
MTQGIYQFPSDNVKFNSIEDKLPPFDIEAEEAVLGAILLDSEAIYRIKDRLKPEHFYVSAHRDIYQACLRLCKKNESTDLLRVTSWLSDHGILARIGGRNKLASVVDSTISSINIDSLATLIIEKAVRRDIIKTGDDIKRLGYETEIELPEIVLKLADKVQSITGLTSVKTKEELQKARYDRLLTHLKLIHTTVPDPAYREYLLLGLAQESALSPSALERIYTKSLTDQCSKLMTYEELQQAAKTSVREWLMNGLLPKRTTVLLYADGGVGKTKLVYRLAKNIIQGSNWGDFISTGEKRRILYYQGDEQESDMYEALETMGYTQDELQSYVRVRFRWNFEQLPILISDLNEFKPHLVVMDSLTFLNRFSFHKEGDMEYARPILELTGLATHYDTTFVLIHHANKSGESRGTTAIRNSVSEVWKLTKDSSNTATPNDRILEIDKSRSRSSGKKYRLVFNQEDLSFLFLGEDDIQGSPAELSTRGKILDFFYHHRNIKYEAIEIAHELGINHNSCRGTLNSLAIDGLISVQRRPSKANLHYLSYENSDHSTDSCNQNHAQLSDQRLLLSDQRQDNPETFDNADFEAEQSESIKKLDQRLISVSDQRRDACPKSNTGDADQPTSKNSEKKSALPKKISENDDQLDQRRPNDLPHNDYGADQAADQAADQGDQPDHLDQPTPNRQFPFCAENSTAKQTKLECPRTGLPLPQPFDIIVDGPLGRSVATATSLRYREDNRLQVQIEYEFADGKKRTRQGHVGKGKPEVEAIAREEITRWQNKALLLPKRRYQVRQLADDDYIWVNNCRLVKIPNPPVECWYVFEAPTGEQLRVRADDEFKLDSLNE